MAFKIKYNKTFLKESTILAEWLEKKWSKEVADDFAHVLYNKIHRLAATPFSGSISIKNKDIRKLIITKHNVVYYRVKGKVIIILSLFNTKLSPQKNKYE